MDSISDILIKNKLLIKTIKLSVISIAANFFGFLIPIYIAYQYAISKKTDDFFLSYSIVLFVGTMFAGSVRTVIIPFLKERLHDREAYNIFISSVFLYLSKLLIIISVGLIIFSGSIYLFSNKQLYWYLLLSVPIVYFSVVNSFFYGILNSLDQFYVAEFSPFSRAIIIFVTIFFFSKSLGMSAVIIGYNLGEIGKFFHLIYIIKKKNGLIISRTLNQPEVLKPFLKQGFYQVISVTLAASSPMVDRVVASFLAVGAVSMLDYGDKIFTVFTVILNSFLTLLLSKWAAEILNDKFKISKLHKIMLAMFIASSLIFIAVYILKMPIISVIYPKVDVNRKEIIALILVINMAGFILNSLNQVINRAVIVLKFTNIMITTSIFRLVTNIVFDIICALIWGVIGVAVASVFMHLAGLLANYYLFKKYNNRINDVENDATIAVQS